MNAGDSGGYSYSNKWGVCASCGHEGLDHSEEETRPVMMIVQELAAAGELFGMLMHGGPFPEEVARLYFRQLIAGAYACARMISENIALAKVWSTCTSSTSFTAISRCERSMC